MSSEMRYSDDDLSVILQDWSESDPDQAVAINLARECLRLRALLARTEAGADGAVWMYRHAKRVGPWSTFHNEQHRANTERDPTWEVRAFYPHPQDASGDAPMSEVEWLHDHLSSTLTSKGLDRAHEILARYPRPPYSEGQATTRELCRAAPAGSGEVELGGWLWGKLMDFCKGRRFHPAEFNDLFAIVSELRALLRKLQQGA